MTGTENIKKLGFGLMRLPRKNDVIDIEETKAMVDAFLAAGFTYFDTAFVYGGSEDAIRQALVERYPRERFQLATKNAAWAGCKTREEAIAQFDISLKQTGAGYFDFYLLHNLGGEKTTTFEKFDMWNWALDMKAQGKIKHLGFSFHAGPEELDDILCKHPEAEFVQLQINYADWENPSIKSRECYEVARKHGKQIVIMEPVKGGMLANPPEYIQKIFKEANKDLSIASWAVRYAASLDGVLTVLSGMSNLEQMEDNLSYMKDFKPLSDDERKVVADVCKAMDEMSMIPCTVCNYCAKVCPMNVGVSGEFTSMNVYTIYDDINAAKEHQKWNVTVPEKKYAKDCIKCGKCEQVCPQHIQIREELAKIAEVLD